MTLQKYIPIQLQAHYDGDALTVCLLTRIKCKDGTLFGYTDLDVNVLYDPAAYDPGGTGDDWGELEHTADTGGFSLARLEAAADLSVDNSELKFLPGTAGNITDEQILSGIFDLADVRIYRVNYADLTMGHECVAVGQLGNARVAKNFTFVEYRSLTDLLKQPEADLFTITCPHVFGGPNCPKAFTWTEFTVTSVDPEQSQRIFGTDITPDDDFYVPGVVEWAEGDNAGSQDDIDQNTGGTFALSLPAKFPIKIGDKGRFRQDCSKLWDDAEHGCLYHWGADRHKYFGGFPDIPVADGGNAMVPGAQINARR